MINGKDIYEILTAIVPLYVTMILAYGSVRWWKIFTPAQCAGINRFVAFFAVPLLSFRFISSSNIYAMSSNYLFLAADCLQKVIILFLLLLWLVIFKRGGIEWTITLFALSTLPNTLIVGIPLLNAMYGEITRALTIQLVVLQGVIWYTVLLILYEYRGAALLIAEQFPETGGAISSFEADPDVGSLSNHKSLQADAEIGEDGKLHVKLKRSTSASSSKISSFDKSHEVNSVVSSRPRVSDILNAEIFSVQSSRWSNVNQTDFQAMVAYNSKVTTPRTSNVEEAEALKIGKRSAIVPSYLPPNLAGSARRKEHGGGAGVTPNNNNRDLHMFVWSSPVSDGNYPQGQLVHGKPATIDLAQEKSSRLTLNQDTEASGGQQAKEPQGAKRQQMPSAIVMARLTLIMVWRKVTRNPNTYASILGLSWALISFKYQVQLPSIVAKSISLLSDTGLGMAMFSLGLFMALQPKIIACGKSLALLGMVIRFFVGPAVMGVTSAALGIRGNLLRVAIIQAALPEGIVPFVFAKEYDVHPAMLSTAVIFGMLVALPIAILYFVILELIH